VEGFFKKIKSILFHIKHSPAFRLLVVLSSLILASSSLVLLFEYKVNKEQFSNLFDSIWWSIVTITTVGYGEKIPASVLGKIIGISTMFLGVGMSGMISGKIASFFVEKNLREGRGLNTYSKIKNHFIVCGWKMNMDKIIDDILLYNKETLLPSNIVIITNAEQHNVDNFRNKEGFDKIKIIRGESSDEGVLNRANIKKASKVMVLASDAENEKATEIDSKTIMSVMTIKNISKEVYVIAELVDKSYKKYLELAGCDEILLSHEYSRILLANSSASSGMSHIIYDILDANTSAAISTREIPENYINKPFGDLIGYFGEKNNILIGILENTGNAYTMKKEALREAQKSPDISMIVKNLKESKKIQINKPLINPSQEYVVKNHDMAIIIESREV
jgi:voltage-gated potassium channel